MSKVFKEDIPAVGTKVEITLKDIFGRPFSVVGKISKEPFHHGYYCKSGAWCLYPSLGDVPCYRFGFVKKKCKKSIALEVERVISIKAMGV